MVKSFLESLQPKRICTIDASTNSLAFAIFDGKDLIRFGKIKFSGKNTYEKVADAARKTKAFFENFQEVEAIIIEHTVFINSPKTAADLALIQGSLLGAAALNGIRTAGSINPIAWQTFIGNGKLTKEEKLGIRKEFPGKSDSWYKNFERDFRKNRTINFVNINYDKHVDDNDVADAIGIGHYAIYNWGKVDK
jgi:Holliday junction resolvasome RuvABC endonuclease subunit